MRHFDLARCCYCNQPQAIRNRDAHTASETRWPVGMVHALYRQAFVFVRDVQQGCEQKSCKHKPDAEQCRHYASPPHSETIFGAICSRVHD